MEREPGIDGSPAADDPDEVAARAREAEESATAARLAEMTALRQRSSFIVREICVEGRMAVDPTTRTVVRTPDEYRVHVVAGTTVDVWLSGWDVSWLRAALGALEGRRRG